MRCVATFALAVALAVVSLSAAQPPTKSKSAKLPYGWSKIGLSDSQKKQATEIITKANAKVMELQAQIEAIRTKEKTDLAGLLTDSQREKLRKVLASRSAGLETPAKDTKQPAPKP